MSVLPQAHLLAEAAAVLGHRFTTNLLAHLTKLEDDRLVHAWDELWRRRLLREEGPATYTFSHDKLQEVVYEQLSPGRRQALHRRAAQALSPHDLRGQASHHERAGQPQEALALYVQAARQEMERFAYHLTGDLLVDWRWHLAELLAALGETPRARQVIAAAYAHLEATAAVMQDETRRRAFFEQVHVHRTIRQIHYCCTCIHSPLASTRHWHAT